MRATRLGIALAVFSNFTLTSCWLTQTGLSSNKCNFTETDSEWVYKTASYFEDGSYKSDVKVTVTDTGAVEHYNSVKGGSMGYVIECNMPVPSSNPTEENPRTITRENYTETYYCKNGTRYSESDEIINFKDENSRYKSRKQMFDKHMEYCKASR